MWHPQESCRVCVKTRTYAHLVKTCIHVYIYICIYMNVHIHICSYMNQIGLCLHTCATVCRGMEVCTCAHVYMNICMHIYTYAYRCNVYVELENGVFLCVISWQRWMLAPSDASRNRTLGILAAMDGCLQAPKKLKSARNYTGGNASCQQAPVAPKRDLWKSTEVAWLLLLLRCLMSALHTYLVRRSVDSYSISGQNEHPAGKASFWQDMFADTCQTEVDDPVACPLSLPEVGSTPLAGTPKRMKQVWLLSCGSLHEMFSHYIPGSPRNLQRAVQLKGEMHHGKCSVRGKRKEQAPQTKHCKVG